MSEIEFHDHWNANSSTTIWQKFKIIFKRGLEIMIRIEGTWWGLGVSIRVSVSVSCRVEVGVFD